MKITLEMDRQGNLQLPSRVRKAAGLHSGTPIECIVDSEGIRLKSEKVPMNRIKRRRDGGKVLTGPAPKIDVVAALSTIRSKRIGQHG
ncbi:hypothetical protein GC207_10730 [bacterium]|nr:hypothetical protein [bacterium]